MPIIIPGNRLANTGYAIDQSIRFNDDDSGRMGRTPSSETNRRTWTFSAWVKRGNLDASGSKFIFSRAEASKAAYIGFYQDDLTFAAASGGIEINLVTDRKFRDPSAWYHIVVAQDTTQAVSSERVRIYINGVRETSFSTETYPSQNYQGYFNTTSLHDIGVSRPSGSISGYFDGYMAEINFLDGYAYDPSYFGETNDNGIWVPKEYTGSYGTNGFHIDGRDASDLGDDESGNGNDFSTSGLASHDQVLDSPTNNFSVFSPLILNTAGSVSRNAVFSNGNLQLDNTTTTGDFPANSIFPPASFKGYAEFYVTHSGSGDFGSTGNNRIMVLDDNSLINSTIWASIYYSTGNITASGESTVSSTAWAKEDVIGVAVDMANNIKWYRNGSLLTTQDVGASYQSLGYMFVMRMSQDSSKNPTIIANYGQEGTFAGNITAGGNSDSNGVGNFKYSVPSGYLALCTKNLGS